MLRDSVPHDHDGYALRVGDMVRVEAAYVFFGDEVMKVVSTDDEASIEARAVVLRPRQEVYRTLLLLEMSIDVGLVVDEKTLSADQIYPSYDVYLLPSYRIARGR